MDIDKLFEEDEEEEDCSFEIICVTYYYNSKEDKKLRKEKYLELLSKDKKNYERVLALTENWLLEQKELLKKLNDRKHKLYKILEYEKNESLFILKRYRIKNVIKRLRENNKVFLFEKGFIKTIEEWIELQKVYYRNFKKEQYKKQIIADRKAREEKKKEEKEEQEIYAEALAEVNGL